MLQLKTVYTSSLLYNIKISKWFYANTKPLTAYYQYKKYDYSTPVSKDLHWLPVREQIEYNVLLISYYTLNDKAHDYLGSFVKPYNLACRCVLAENAVYSLYSTIG